MELTLKVSMEEGRVHGIDERGNTVSFELYSIEGLILRGIIERLTPKQPKPIGITAECVKKIALMTGEDAH